MKLFTHQGKIFDADQINRKGRDPNAPMPAPLPSGKTVDEANLKPDGVQWTRRERTPEDRLAELEARLGVSQPAPPPEGLPVLGADDLPGTRNRPWTREDQYLAELERWEAARATEAKETS
jgi:hypothetical protein